MVDMTKLPLRKTHPGDIRGVFIRSNLFQGSWNFERMQALGFCFSMVPAIKRLYPENNEARRQAIKRHLEFFNTHPYVAAPVLGVTLAMEEQRANGAEIDDGAINGIKVGLMGRWQAWATRFSGVPCVRSLRRWAPDRHERQPARSSAVLHPVQRGASADPLLRRGVRLS